MSVREAFVIGDPISQSLSPCLFHYLFNRLGISDLDYTGVRIAPKELSLFIRKIRSNMNFIGCNITTPHKEAVLAHLNALSPTAQAIGAVNVIQKMNGSLIGHNTDVFGIQKTLLKLRCKVENKRVLILGAGGSARSVAYALGMLKAKEVEVLNTNRLRAENLVQQVGTVFQNTRFRVCSKIHGPIDLWINTTPVGMTDRDATRDRIPALDYFTKVFQNSRSFRPRNASAFDLIYSTRLDQNSTPFLKAAKEMQLETIDGLEMLVEQALGTWKIWFGDFPTITLADALTLKLTNYLRFRPVFLAGFMGAGKSTVGPLLAKALRWNFLDLDDLVKQESGIEIPRFFQENGENAFRALEKQMILRYGFSDRTVIALGGGTLTHLPTRKLIEKQGRLVLLSAKVNTVLERLKKSGISRPLLESLSPDQLKNKVLHLLEERREIYEAICLKVVTDSLTPEQVVLNILENL